MIHYTSEERAHMNKAMRLSVVIGIFMLIIKVYAYFLTGSSAILSDAAESVVHVFAVSFAAYSMWFSHKPPDQDHTYGHDRITFFSAGFEGALIAIAALFILYQAIKKFFFGIELENLDVGVVFISMATVLNGFLGLYLVRLGTRLHSIVLQADGKHILTDCLTSLGVILALVLTRLTSWLYFDPLLALAIGCNILWTGGRLLYHSFHGLMDRADPALGAKIRALLQQETADVGVDFHHLRHRNAGNRLMIEVHLLFPSELPITRAHELATHIERKMEGYFEQPTEMMTHLEPLEGHDEVHMRLLGHQG